MPPNETCTAKGITLHDELVDWAAAGDHVSLTLVGMDIIKINVGCIFVAPKSPLNLALVSELESSSLILKFLLLKDFLCCYTTRLSVNLLLLND